MKTIRNNSSKYAAVEFLCAAVSAGLWFFIKGLTWQPVLLLLPLLILRLVQDRSAIKITLSTVFVIAFFVSAVVGWRISYNTVRAADKFWIIISSIALYFAVSRQPTANLRLIILLLGIVGAGLSIVFLFGHDWTINPVDFGFVNRIAFKWMGIRPKFGVRKFNEDIVGGVLAFIFLLQTGQLLSSLKNKLRFEVILFLSLLILLSIGLFMTASRAALVGLFAAISMGAIFRANIFDGEGKRDLVIGGILLSLSIAAFVGVVRLQVVDEFIRSESLQSRILTFRDSLRLINDFLFTGGGLRSFPGLYSTEVLRIPYLYLAYSHNLLLDLWIEQGVLGMVSFVLLYLAAAVKFLSLMFEKENRRDDMLLSIAGCFVLLFFSGLVENPFYGDRGTPLLFLIPGFTEAFDRAFRADKGEEQVERKRTNGYSKWKWISGLALIILLVFGVISQKDILVSKWQSNAGAVRMAKTELYGWPEDAIGEFEPLNLSEEEALFEQSLNRNPNNVTSIYRLGRIEMRKRNFKKAAEYLELALARDPDHRGINKTLAYSYAWAGDVEKAVDLFAELPDTIQELKVYEWWWASQDEMGLAENARLIDEALQNQN